MKIFNNRITGILFLFITALFYVVLTITVKMPLNSVDSKIWKGYYTLLLEADAPMSSIVSDLQELGKWEIVSEYSSQVQVFNHNEDLFISVSDLKDFYVKGDPLFDPFLQKLSSFFFAESATESYHIVYIRSDLSSSSFSNKIGTIMAGYSCSWLLPELKKESQILSMTIFIMFMSLLLFWNRELWPVLIPGMLPWFIFAAGSGLPGVLVSIIFQFGWITLGSQLYKSFRRFLNLGEFDPVDMKKLIMSIFIMVLSVVYLFLNSGNLSQIAAYSMAILAHFCSVAFYVIVLDYKRRLQQHRIFFPVRIRHGNRNVNRPDLAVFSAFILIIIISPLFFQENMTGSEIKLPVPVKIEGISDFSKVSIQILNTHSGQSELPDLSDYISHMMFLETYPYGYNYLFPEPDDVMSVPLFSMEDGGITKKNVNINMFTDMWYESIISSGLNTSIIRLLFSQDSPTLVSYMSESRGFLTDEYLRNHYWISIFLVLSLVLWLSNLSPSGWYDLKEFMLRRKQQVV
ncbi:MAG: hypothetical protein KAR21_05280 [Spirochaetales bacterium]|nr:hypothetical protein [Spirochaetales bacterium]